MTARPRPAVRPGRILCHCRLFLDALAGTPLTTSPVLSRLAPGWLPHRIGHTACTRLALADKARARGLGPRETGGMVVPSVALAQTSAPG